MSAQYAFIAGAIIVALGLFWVLCAIFRVNFFFRFTRAAREVRWFGLEAARVMYIAAGGLAILGGMCFWGWGAMILLEQRVPRTGPQLGQPYAVPKPVTRPAASDHSLGDPVELEPGYWIRPPRNYLTERVVRSEEGGRQRSVYCWRHPEDLQRFVAYAFTEDSDRCALLAEGAAPGDSGRGQFLVERFHALQRELGGPTLSPEGNEQVANFDGLLMFGRRTRPGQQAYGGVYYAGCDDGRLIEFALCELGNSGTGSSFRSFERRGASAAPP